MLKLEKRQEWKCLYTWAEPKACGGRTSVTAAALGEAGGLAREVA